MASLKTALGIDELTDKKSNIWRALFAEFFGTMLLNFFGCGAVVTNNVVAIALAFGLVVAGVIQSIGHVSGGHINPAVTMGLLAIGKISVVKGFLYVIAQCAGAIAGSGVLYTLSTDNTTSSIGVVSLVPGLVPFKGFAIEFFLALILVMVVCGACDPAKPESKGIAPLIIGLAVTVGHIVGIPRTGAGMNPARSLGSAVIMSKFENHWVYWIGPILGGMVGACFYTYAIKPASLPVTPKNYASIATDDKEKFEYIDSGRGGL
ncbi:aquaporin AQPAn.G-like isoform X2 [Aphidius gifuensis]|uniref:aquaporin AQPAn.G-like isoform X2 n=1 Tax=Aphidius gifuensis TaxID=684658 RepID=UPI001CDC9369|nr:aquaporin AQPAn.G-like isoform X2 [Aphidius gifuensis]